MTRRIIIIDDDSPKSDRRKERRVKCKVCKDGIDYRNSLLGVPCELCGGTGWRRVVDCPTVTCPICKGKGVDYRHALRGVVCERCNGIGEIPI